MSDNNEEQNIQNAILLSIKSAKNQSTKYSNVEFEKFNIADIEFNESFSDIDLAIAKSFEENIKINQSIVQSSNLSKNELSKDDLFEDESINLAITLSVDQNINQDNIQLTQEIILNYLDSIGQMPAHVVINKINSFETFILTDSDLKPVYVPHNLFVIKFEGDGLCWLNSLVCSIFAIYSNDTNALNAWINSIIETFKFDQTFVPIMGLNSYPNIRLRIFPNAPNESNIVKFINANRILIKILVFNILKFCVKNYYNTDLHITNRILPFNTAIAFDLNQSRFIAIDSQLRNFTMSVMGITKVIVWQHNINSTNRRHTNIDCNLTAIDYYGEYAGFEISNQNTINIRGSIGSVLLYSNNSEHYDGFFDNNTCYTTVALDAYDNELPNFI